MDYVLHFLDRTLLTPHVYPASWPEDDIYRQFLSLFVFTSVGAIFVYLISAALNYFFLFDHKLMTHKLFLENQVRGLVADCTAHGLTCCRCTDRTGDPGRIVLGSADGHPHCCPVCC